MKTFSEFYGMILALDIKFGNAPNLRTLSFCDLLTAQPQQLSVPELPAVEKRNTCSHPRLRACHPHPRQSAVFHLQACEDIGYFSTTQKSIVIILRICTIGCEPWVNQQNLDDLFWKHGISSRNQTPLTNTYTCEHL